MLPRSMNPIPLISFHTLILLPSIIQYKHTKNHILFVLDSRN